MLIKTFGSAVYGVEATTITIEVNWIQNQGKDPMIVGLPDNAVKESLQRIELQAGIGHPAGKIRHQLRARDHGQLM